MQGSDVLLIFFFFFFPKSISALGKLAFDFLPSRSPASPGQRQRGAPTPRTPAPHVSTPRCRHRERRAWGIYGASSQTDGLRPVDSHLRNVSLWIMYCEPRPWARVSGWPYVSLIWCFDMDCLDSTRVHVCQFIVDGTMRPSYHR
ncbi:hypothetical protein F5Y13DRAFT_75813 [Hypoxylon sp. FL1857]|nr:hypothetical protein F5Y13DRAFT_75813 [Hypoxylon sp. FL1857]